MMAAPVEEPRGAGALGEVRIGDPEHPGQHLPARVAKSASNNTLSSRNLSLHDGAAGQLVEEAVDLDQTTMIGSALDLDSLDGGEREQAREQSQSGSQVGLLKLSAV